MFNVPTGQILFFRTREDEVHVAVGCAYPKVEPSYHEVGPFSGSHPGEQQRGRTQGEGLSSLLTELSTSLIVFFRAAKLVGTTPLIGMNLLLLQLSEMSDIPLENLEFAKVCAFAVSRTAPSLLLVDVKATSPPDFFAQGKGTFPCDISVLEIHQDLDWNPKVSTLNVWPLYICDDGAVVFYR